LLSNKTNSEVEISFRTSQNTCLISMEKILPRKLLKQGDREKLLPRKTV